MHRRLLTQDAVDHRLFAFQTADTDAATPGLHPVAAGIVGIHLMQRPDRALLGITRVRRMRAGSVGMRLTFCVTEAASSRKVIVLLYDLDIF